MKTNDIIARQARAVDALVAAVPFNAMKEFEYGHDNAVAPTQRMLASLVNVSPVLASGVASGLGMPVPAALPKAIERAPLPEVQRSDALSLMALPGECGIRTRQIAILVADGVHGASIATLHSALLAAGAVAHFIGPRVGKFIADGDAEIEANKSLENSPSVLFDALVLPDGANGIETLARDGHTMEYVKDQFRHGKTILALGASRKLLAMAGIAPSPGGDAGLIFAESAQAADVAPAFIAGIAAHRHPSRDSDPPKI